MQLEGVVFLDPDGDSLVYIFSIIFFIITSAIISASETAFRTVNIRQIQTLVNEGKRSALNLSGLLKNPATLLATIMVSHIIANVSIVTLIAMEVFKHDNLKNSTGMALVICITSAVLFVFTGLLPKTYAANNPERVALQMSYPMKLLYYIFKPVVYLVSVSTGPLLSIISRNFGQLFLHLSEAEIKTLVDISHESRVLEQYETKIIQSAFAIDELTVNSILTPRVDIECVSVDTTIEETLDLMLEAEYSRMPVYEDNIDNIVGIVHIKDLFKFTKDNPENIHKSVQSLTRDAFHVPENKTISELLKEMQAKRVQMAIISDEYGGTAGLVTMEDILEEIVGEIRDEHDIDELPLIYEIDRDTILVDAKVGVGEINRILGTNLPNNQTIGRLIFDTLGEVPKLEQVIKIDDIDLRIKEIDGIRVQKVLVSKNPVNLPDNINTEKGEVSVSATNGNL
jgi:putative hemolysin